MQNLCLKYLMKNKGKNYHVNFSIPEDDKPVVTADIIFSRIFFRTNFNAHFNMNMYVTLSSTRLGP